MKPKSQFVPEVSKQVRQSYQSPKIQRLRDQYKDYQSAQ
jgi:hypothetical protein